MTIDTLLKNAEKFELDTYKKPPDFLERHVSFTGMPEKHPYDPGKIILIADPLSTNVSYYEFDITDIEGAEELPNLGTIDGKSVRIIRIWVRRGSIGIRSTPFVVEDTVKR